MGTTKIFASLVLFGSLASAASGPQMSHIRNSELRLGSIQTGQTSESIIREIGSPNEKKITDEGIELYYPGLIVYVGKSGVYEMESTSEKMCTPAKLCPGMTLSAAKSIYGEPVVAERPHGTFLEYYAEGISCWLQLAVVDNVIATIRVECQP